MTDSFKSKLPIITSNNPVSIPNTALTTTATTASSNGQSPVPPPQSSLAMLKLNKLSPNKPILPRIHSDSDLNIYQQQQMLANTTMPASNQYQQSVSTAAPTHPITPSNEIPNRQAILDKMVIYIADWDLGL